MNRLLIKIENNFIVIGFILTVLIISAAVTARYIFHFGVGWSEELVRYIMIWITFVGLGVAIRTEEHVAIDFFVEKLGRHKKRVIKRIGHFICFLFCLLLFASSLMLTIKVFYRGQITAGLQIPMGVIYSMLPVAMLISTFRYLILIFKHL